MDYIVKECERAIAADMCVVIGLQSTGESGLNAGLEEHGSVDYSGKQVQHTSQHSYSLIDLCHNTGVDQGTLH